MLSCGLHIDVQYVKDIFLWSLKVIPELFEVDITRLSYGIHVDLQVKDLFYCDL